MLRLSGLKAWLCWIFPFYCLSGPLVTCACHLFMAKACSHPVGTPLVLQGPSLDSMCPQHTDYHLDHLWIKVDYSFLDRQCVIFTDCCYLVCLVLQVLVLHAGNLAPPGVKSQHYSWCYVATLPTLYSTSGDTMQWRSYSRAVQGSRGNPPSRPHLGIVKI